MKFLVRLWWHSHNRRNYINCERVVGQGCSGEKIPYNAGLYPNLQIKIKLNFKWFPFRNLGCLKYNNLIVADVTIRSDNGMTELLQCKWMNGMRWDEAIIERGTNRNTLFKSSTPDINDALKEVFIPAFRRMTVHSIFLLVRFSLTLAIHWPGQNQRFLLSPSTYWWNS